MTQELLSQMGKKVDESLFKKEFKKHQNVSRMGADKKFKGGLGDKNKETVKLHTATHLLHQALREVLGEEVRQEGSNITAERLRFDFSYAGKFRDEDIKKVEDLINKKIDEDLAVYKTIESKKEALKSGALSFFKETYPERVSIYTIGKDVERNWFSKEFCGGPHVNSTGEIGGVRIKKVKSIGANNLRVYIVFENKKDS